MPRKGSTKSAEPVVERDKEDWAKLYGQPEKPRTVESYEAEWSRHNAQQEAAESSSEAEQFSPSAPPSESDDVLPEPTVRLRRKRRSKSQSPRQFQQLEKGIPDCQKRWSRPPIVVDDFWSRQTSMICLMFIFLILVLIALSYVHSTTEKTFNQIIRPNRMPQFNKKLQDLKQQFVNQPEHNWNIIRGAFAEVLNHSNYDHGPAILMILASKKDQHLATCFSEKLALSLSSTFHSSEKPIVLNGAKLRNSRNSYAAKHTIDDAVKDRDNFVMQFTSLEQIEPYVASIFHSLCDYYNSPFKQRAVFIFTVHTNEDIEGRHRKEYDKMADRVLDDAWDELDINKRSALLSRLTGHTILLHHESRRVC